jgi:hypothetical protein
MSTTENPRCKQRGSFLQRVKNIGFISGEDFERNISCKAFHDKPEVTQVIKRGLLILYITPSFVLVTASLHDPVSQFNNKAYPCI